MTAAFLALLRVEFLTLLRTREATLFALLPAALFLPIVVMSTVLAVSLSQSDGTVAVPLEDPPGFGLGAALDDGWTVLRSADPTAELVAGRAQVAVTRWTVGAPGEAWVDVDLAGDASLVSSLEQALRKGVTGEIDRRIEAAGGTPVVDRTIASVRVTGSLDRTLGQILRLVPYWMAFTASYLGCFLVPVRTAAERLSGGLETFAVTSGGVGVVFAARALVGSAFSTALVALPVGSLWLMFGSLWTGYGPLQATDLVEALSLVVLAHVGFVGCGLVAGSTRTALYMASYLVLFAPLLVAVRFWTPLPWVPLVGTASEGSLVAWGARVGATLALAAVSLALLARLARHERVLPSGTSDE